MSSLIEVKIQPSLFRLVLCLACFGLVPLAEAVLPPPDGGYPGFNTAEGQSALFSLTTGQGNTGVGWFSLSSDTGSFNTAIGAATLLFNTADRNTATGAAALFSSTTGTDNTANGVFALFSNTEGEGNTATGGGALYSNTSGINNTANGLDTLHQNTTGGANTANGYQALFQNTTGFANTATGYLALTANMTGFRNTAIGGFALRNSSGSGNIALGFNAGTHIVNASDVILIGADPSEDVSNSCYIGNIYSNVQPIVGTDPDSVTVASNGKLGRGNVSSRRYKHDIQPMNRASEVLYALQPVSFRYNKEYDAAQTLAFGLIAEEVAEVIPDLVGRNPKGEPESVRYEQINAMLLNEFLKAHGKIEEQEAAIARMQKQIEALTACLQRVSAVLELPKAPRVVATDP
jgi:trimeric autotransporter adhesin